MTLWSYTRAASMSQSDTTTDDPQIPQPDLRFVIRKQTNKSKHTAQKRGKAQQKHPQNKQMLPSQPSQWEKTHCENQTHMKSDQTNYSSLNWWASENEIYSRNKVQKFCTDSKSISMDIATDYMLRSLRILSVVLLLQKPKHHSK